MRIIISVFVMGFLWTSANIAQPPKRLEIEGLEKVQSESQTQGERWGLLIGIENYDDPRVTDLRYSIDDVRQIAEILQDPARGAFQHLKVLASDATDAADLPTRVNILRALNGWLSQAKPEDTVLFFFSGHGATDDHDRNYLIPVDAQVDLLEDTAIPMERLNEILDNRKQIEAKKVIVILDSCHSGAKVGQKAFTVEGKLLDPLFTDAEGRITFASCDRDESSYENEALGHGVFSYYMAEGLKGAGDRNEDGYIDADELFTYVADSVRSWAKQRGYKQTPRKQANVTGEVLIGYDPENLARKQQEAAQEAFDAYRKKLRSIIALNVTELTQAEKLLERQMRGEPLSEAEKKWVQLIHDLADKKINVELYRLAIRGLRSEASPTEKQTGSIVVNSEPPFAQVTLDGVLQTDHTPMILADVTAGSHTLRLTLNGYRDWEQAISVEGGKSAEINAELIEMRASQLEQKPTPPIKKRGKSASINGLSLSAAYGFNTGDDGYNNGKTGLVNVRYGLLSYFSVNGKAGRIDSDDETSFVIGELLFHIPLAKDIFTHLGGGGGLYHDAGESGQAISGEAGIELFIGRWISINGAVLIVRGSVDEAINVLPHGGLSLSF